VIFKTGTAGVVALVLLQSCGSSGSSNDDGDKTLPVGNVGAPATPVAMQPATPAQTVVNQPATQPTGMAGSSANPIASNPKPADPPQVDPPKDDTPKPAMDECGLNTKWVGDEYCIKPPDADKGFQVHTGPTNYDNPEPQYVLEPGGEVTENFSATTGNATDVYYYYRQYRMRPGSHHVIYYSSGGAGGGIGGFGGKRIGGTQNLVKDNPENGKIAPENQDVGMPLAAHTQLSISLHYINLTDQPIIKEVWTNFWYRDAKDVKEPAIEMFSMAPISIPPGSHVLLHGSCPITEAGRVVTLYGHRHANNLRFAAWHEHGGQKDLIFDDYDWEHPYVAEFSSLVMNPAPDPAKKTPGAASGVMSLAVGDTLSFECEIVNDTDSTFVGQNEAKNDEMCILVGDTVGTTVPSFCDYTTTDL